MGFVTALRELLRFRLFVAVWAVASIAVGVLMTYHVSLSGKFESRRYQVGIASARALVDTPSSQVVDLGSKTGADIGTLASRANLLSSLMTSSPLKDEIARRAGVPNDMLVTGSAAAAPGGGGVSGTVISADDPRANILKTSVPTLESGEIPIIAVETQAPDPAVAARLADQAILVLQRHLDDVAGTEAVPAGRRVIVRELGQARSALVDRGPSPIVAVIAVLFVFGLGCVVILAVSGLVGMWRTLKESERVPPAVAGRWPADDSVADADGEGPPFRASSFTPALITEADAAASSSVPSDGASAGAAETESTAAEASPARRPTVAALQLLGSRAGRDER